MKKASAVLLFLTFMLTAVPQVLALELRITSNGQVLVYEDGVLGKTTGQITQATNARPVKTISPEAGQKIRIHTTQDKVNVEVRQPDANVNTSEKMETNRLKMTAPAGPSPSDTRQLDQEEQRKREAQQLEVKRVEANIETMPEERREQVKEQVQARLDRPEKELTEEQSERRQKIRAERQERHQEQLEVRSELNAAGEPEIALETRDITARIKRGAQFQIDPTTNQVSIITPSGNVHVLEHLPDQAIERMKEAGLFSDIVDEETVEIETKDTGEVVYQVAGKRRKHAFGFIPRDVETEIELDDTTGEVTESEVPSDSILGQFLDAVSF